MKDNAAAQHRQHYLNILRLYRSGVAKAIEIITREAQKQNVTLSGGLSQAIDAVKEICDGHATNGGGHCFVRN